MISVVRFFFLLFRFDPKETISDGSNSPLLVLKLNSDRHFLLRVYGVDLSDRGRNDHSSIDMLYVNVFFLSIPQKNSSDGKLTLESRKTSIIPGFFVSFVIQIVRASKWSKDLVNIFSVCASLRFGNVTKFRRPQNMYYVF
jgi:hypothetical protein